MKITGQYRKLIESVFPIEEEVEQIIGYLKQDNYTAARIFTADHLDALTEFEDDYKYENESIPKWINKDRRTTQKLYDFIMLELEKQYE